MTYKNTTSSFYQLTPDILMEFIHFNVDNISQADVNRLGYEKPNFNGNYDEITDNKLLLYTNTNNNTKYIIRNINSSEDSTNNTVFNSSVSRDDSEVKFTKLTYNNIPDGYISEPINPDGNNKLLYDIIVLHFTNGNYMSNYDGFIISNNIYDNKNNKIYLSSVEFKKSDIPEFEDSPLLIAEKLYTSKFQFRIPNVECFENTQSSLFFDIINQLTDGSGLLENTPINISLKGIKKTYDDIIGNTIYETEEIANIKVPYIDRFQNINVNIDEAEDGDYFTIAAEAKNQSMSDYLFTHGLTNVTIMHDLSLTEHYFDVTSNTIKSELTRREYFIVGINDGVSDTIDDKILYRPIAVKENIISFTIQDTLRIYNNDDQTTIVKVGSLTYGTGQGQSVFKYGKFIERIADPSVFQVKVFNKRTDIDDVPVKIVNTQTAGFNAPDKVAVTKFIDSKNIAVSVQQVQVTE